VGSARILPVAIVAMLAMPAVANAHLRSDIVAVDYQVTVTTESNSFAARVYETDRALRLIAMRGHSLVVLGYLGEPLIRIDDCERGIAERAEHRASEEVAARFRQDSCLAAAVGP
jgi:hypothetical protein